MPILSVSCVFEAVRYCGQIIVQLLQYGMQDFRVGLQISLLQVKLCLEHEVLYERNSNRWLHRTTKADRAYGDRKNNESVMNRLIPYPVHQP